MPYVKHKIKHKMICLLMSGLALVLTAPVLAQEMVQGGEMMMGGGMMFACAIFALLLLILTVLGILALWKYLRSGSGN